MFSREILAAAILWLCGGLIANFPLPPIFCSVITLQVFVNPLVLQEKYYEKMAKYLSLCRARPLFGYRLRGNEEEKPATPSNQEQKPVDGKTDKDKDNDAKTRALSVRCVRD